MKEKKNESKEILKKLTNIAEKDFGKKCKDYAPTCPICVIHRSIENLKYFLEEVFDEE